MLLRRRMTYFGSQVHRVSVHHGGRSSSSYRRVYELSVPHISALKAKNTDENQQWVKLQVPSYNPLLSGRTHVPSWEPSVQTKESMEGITHSVYHGF